MPRPYRNADILAVAWFNPDEFVCRPNEILFVAMTTMARLVKSTR